MLRAGSSDKDPQLRKTIKLEFQSLGWDNLDQIIVVKLAHG